jgi:hypothetical protein
MADNQFVEVVSKEAAKQIREVTSATTALVNEMMRALSVQDKLATSLKGAKSPSQINAVGAGSSANVQSVAATVDKNIKLLERQRLAELKLQKDRENAFVKYEKQLQKEQAVLRASESLYNKIQQKLNTLNNEYRDLAAKKQLDIALTDKEAARYDFLSKRITKYDGALKAVDASMGKHQRNVGNYASGFSPLSNSISQLSRELPALAINFNTFFLAISNNLPAFFDAMKEINIQNKALAETGQQGVSAFNQLKSAIFSWGTALSIGVTLLTLFGGRIAEVIFNTEEKTKADEASKKATEDKNDAEKRYLDTIKGTASEEISRSKLLFENAKNVNLSLTDRRRAIDELRERYPKYLKNLSDQDILAGRTADTEQRLNDALVKRGIALALQDKIREAYSKLTDEIIKQQKEEESLLTIGNRIRSANQQNIKSSQGQASEIERIRKQEAEQVKLAIILNQNRVLSSKESQKQIQSEIQGLIDLYNKYSPYLDSVEEATGKTKEVTQATEEYAETNSKVAFERIISTLQNKIDLMSKENALYGFLSKQLELVMGAYEALYGEQEKSNEEMEKTLKYGTVDYYESVISGLQAEQRAVADSTEQYQLYGRMIGYAQAELDKLMGKEAEAEKPKENAFLQGFIDSFASDTGFDTFFDVMQGKIEGFGEDWATTFNAITEIAQETFAFLNQNQQAYFDAQYVRLEREKDIALRFAGENAAGREEIERQYEERRREIRRRELQAQKEQAIFNATINTAQGVTSALATANIPLSIIIAALGAAQIAMIASREIPAYKMGTDNHEGGLAYVGDGGKHEAVWQPSSGWSITPNKTTLVNLEKGSKVLPDAIKAPIFNTANPFVMDMNGGSSNEAVMVEAMREMMGKLQPVNVNINRNGIDAFVQERISKTRTLNNIVSFKGMSVK